MGENKYLTYLLEEGRKQRIVSPESFAFSTTNHLATVFEQKVTAVNHQLNKLYKAGALIKINSKPVYYLSGITLAELLGKEPLKELYSSFEELLAEYNQDILEQLIGANKSLVDVLRQCKVALKYPTNGLPLLLTGATGTGKTFLVKQLYEYALAEKILTEDAPLTIFNCAEYADNPELLTSKLFGHKKGSFTGADSDREGLLALSDGGILLIDEVHRLSSESQEKLFYFIDEGKYKPLGENSQWSYAKVRLMFATTESLDEYLLDTFVRRIPIVTKVPSLEQRGYQEKRAFLLYFLKKEALNVGQPIVLSRELFHFLTAYPYPGNVGEMENLIKYLVGNAFVQQGEVKAQIEILVNYLPKALKTQAIQQIDLFNDKQISVAPSGQVSDPDSVYQKQALEQIFVEISALLVGFLEKQLEPLAFVKESYQLIEHYLVIQRAAHMVDQQLIEQLKESLGEVRQTMYDIHQIDFSKESQQMIQDYLEVILGLSEPIVFDLGQTQAGIERLKSEYSVPYNQTYLFKELLYQVLPYTDAKLSFLDILMFLVIVIYYNNSYASEQIQGVIICHGYATASSLAQTANKMIGQRVFHGIDMALDVSFHEITQKLRRYLSLHETRNGTVILVDIGHTEDLRLALQERVEGPFAVIDNVSTKLALDVGFKIINHEHIGHLASSASETHYSQFSLFEPEKPKEKALIISCQTGIGTAQKLKDIFAQNLPTNEMIKLVVTDFSYLSKMKTNTTFFARYEIIGVIGTTDPQVTDVPYLGLDEMMSEEGINHLQEMFGDYLDAEEIHHLNNGLMQTLSLENLVTLLSILNPEKTIQLISEMIELWEAKFVISIPNNLRTALYIHISCMIERVITRTYVENQTQDLQVFEEAHAYFVQVIREGLAKFETVYHVTVDLGEIAYLHQLIGLNLKEFDF